MIVNEVAQGAEALAGLPALPKSWCWSVPEDICEVVASGSTPKPTLMYAGSGEVPFIKVYNLTERGLLDFSVKPTFVDRSTHERLLARSRVIPGDVLINIVGPPLGKVAIVPEDFPEWNINQAIAIFRPREGIDNKYLAFAFQTDSIMYRVTSLAKATAGQSNIGVGMCRRLLPVPIAPLNEQRRIVANIEELFSDLDAAVAALTRAKANLKRYRAAVLKAAVEGKLTEAWRAEHPEVEPATKLLDRILAERRRKWEAAQQAKFAAAGKPPPKDWRSKYAEPKPPDTTGLPELPEAWCWASTEQTSEVQGGIQKQPKRAPQKNHYPFLRVANVHRNRLELDDVHQIELFGDELERLRLRAGDMLVVEGNGSKSEIGRSAIWMGQVDDCVHQNHIIRIRFFAGTSRYLNAYWNSPTGNGKVMDQAASTSGLYTLSVTKVCALPIPLAPLAEQEDIVAEVESKLSLIAAAETEIDHGLLRAARLRQSILKQAFEGKLVPQDPQDEPASALLSGIAAKALQSARSKDDNNKQESRGRRSPRRGVRTSSN
jgi:type I restriction enzyme, S subunit